MPENDVKPAIPSPDEMFAGPLPAIVKQFLAALFEAAPKLWRIFRDMGGRDGFLTALDAALEVSRQKARADIRHKHGR